MKSLIYIFLFVFTTSCLEQEKPLFKTLRIKYTFGDEGISSREMTFNLEGKSVVGKIIIPNTDKLYSSRTVLSNKSIVSLNSFVKLAKSYPKGCEEWNGSSYVQSYEVEIDKNLKIYSYCDWKSLTFEKLEKEIFESYFEEMPVKI